MGGICCVERGERACAERRLRIRLACREADRAAAWPDVDYGYRIPGAALAARRPGDDPQEPAVLQARNRFDVRRVAARCNCRAAIPTERRIPLPCLQVA